MDSSTSQLPPEILSLVFNELEGDKASLKSCLLACNSWHDLSLPYVYHNLAVPNDLIYLRLYRRLMIDAPHLCCHVRRIDISGFGAPGTLDSFTLEWCDDDHIQSFLQAFPRLNALRCSSLLYKVVPRILPCTPITTLHIESSLSYDVIWLFRILRAGAATIKNLKLEDIDFRFRLSPSDTPNGGKISMLALEELTVIECCNLPFHINTVEMPNLKVLVCRDYYCIDYLHILRTSLKTLVIEPTIEEPLEKNQIIVDNLCILWFAHQEVEYVETTIASVCVPTKIVHLEFCLPGTLPTHPLTTSSDDLEAFVLRLHLDGSLRRVTVTVKEPSDAETLDGVFKELNSLGILDIRVGKPPLLHPSALL